jgi:AraC-like DNA-binding protein
MNPPSAPNLDLLPPLNAVGIVACLLVILILLFRQGYRARGGGLLLVSFLVLFYPLLIVYLYDTGSIRAHPHLLRTSAPVGLLYMPTMYLYVRTLATRRPLRWLDALHLLPALLFVVDFLPFYALPADAKRQLVLGSGYWKQLLRFDEGWLLPPYWHHYIRSVQVVVYWVLEARIVLGLLRQTDFRARNRAWFTWMLTLLVLQLFPFVPAAGVTLFGWNTTVLKFWYDLSLKLMALLSCVALLLRPEILYGLQNAVAPDSPAPAEQPQPDDRESPAERLENYIPPSLIAVYDRQIREFMRTREAFLRPGYTLREMAENTGIPLHHLSAVINRHYGYHFNEYINHWRVEYLKQRLDKREWKHKTLEALARESGFTNRTSFITAFKKHCGTTPSDYIRSMKDPA